jgi:aromatic-L-amino-acid decarboxylase
MHESKQPVPFEADEFQQELARLGNWIADYYARLPGLPVLSRVAPGAVRAALPDVAPEHGERFDAVLADLDRVIVPGLTHWQSPSFFAYFPANSSGPSIEAELLSAALGVQGMLWQTSPACTELESLVLDWLVAACGLPASFLSSGAGGGVLQDSASSALLCALLAARERATGGAGNEEGYGGGLVAYGSTQAHSSLDKAMMIAGLGRRALRKVAVDANHALDPADLARQLATDRALGLTPAFVCATVGTTSTLACDPLPAIGRICRDAGAWLHVDAAMAGSAALLPECRPLLAGLEYADSYCFNPHKWLLTNFDCSCFYVACRADLIAALAVNPAYLGNEASAAGAVIDYRDWQIPLGRRFRALKLWFVLRRFGLSGLRALLRHHLALAAEFARWVAADPHFELVAPVTLNLVCFRYRGDDEQNRRLQRALNDSGRLFMSHTELNGQHVLRFCIGQGATQESHVRAAWQAVSAAADALN